MENFEVYWKDLAKRKVLISKNFVERAILIAMRAKGNAPKEDIVHSLLQKYFSPITNKNKLNHGRTKFDIIKRFVYWNKVRRDPASASILDQPIGNIFETESEVKQYYELMDSINVDKLHRKYVYYFTVQDGLTPEQQGVQAGHALFVLADTLNKEKISFNPRETYFQWIGVKYESELYKIINKHETHNYVTFREPDLKNKLTTVAFYPVYWNKREEFMDYSLLVHNSH